MLPFTKEELQCGIEADYNLYSLTRKKLVYSMTESGFTNLSTKNINEVFGSLTRGICEETLGMLIDVKEMGVPNVDLQRQSDLVATLHKECREVFKQMIDDLSEMENLSDMRGSCVKMISETHGLLAGYYNEDHEETRLNVITSILMGVTDIAELRALLWDGGKKGFDRLVKRVKRAADTFMREVLSNDTNTLRANLRELFPHRRMDIEGIVMDILEDGLVETYEDFVEICDLHIGRQINYEEEAGTERIWLELLDDTRSNNSRPSEDEGLEAVLNNLSTVITHKLKMDHDPFKDISAASLTNQDLLTISYERSDSDHGVVTHQISLMSKSQPDLLERVETQLVKVISTDTFTMDFFKHIYCYEVETFGSYMCKVNLCIEVSEYSDVSNPTKWSFN